MSVKPATYYEVECDKPGCGRKTSDLGSDYSAFADESQALEDWREGDGWVNDKTGETFCYSHRPALCAGCDELATGLDKDNEYVCADHEPVAPLIAAVSS